MMTLCIVSYCIPSGNSIASTILGPGITPGNNILNIIFILAIIILSIISIANFFSYGINTPDKNELLASNHDLEDMRKFVNATTLQFLSIEGLYKSMGFKKRNSSYPQFTDHCFTGEYPVKPIDASGKDFLDNQLTLMSSKS